MVNRLPRRFAAGLAAAFACGATLLVITPTPAHAAACSTTASGVTVVVDFAALGGGVGVSCASGDPATGYAALHAAGFSTTGTGHDGPAFVCRINNKPSSAQEKCVLTPPTNAYWSYWHAQPGGSWTYSQLGVLSYDPKPGTVEGWAFGAGSQPGISPPQPVAPAPTPPSTQPPPAQPPPAPPPPGQPPPTTTRTSGGPPGAGAAATTEAPPGPTQSTLDSGTSTSASSSVDGTVPDSSSAPADASAIAPPPIGGGGPGGTLLGVAVVAALAMAGGIIAFRRRLWTPTIDHAPDQAPDQANGGSAGAV